MKKLGNADASIILCNRCGKRIAVKGIRIQEVRRGEHRVTFFDCSHCGATYQINTTDQRQRDLFQKRDAAMKRVAAAVRFKFRQKEITDNRKKAAAIEKQIRGRAAELRSVGEEILSENGKRGGMDGSENSDRGAEGVQED